MKAALRISAELAYALLECLPSDRPEDVTTTKGVKGTLSHATTGGVAPAAVDDERPGNGEGSADTDKRAADVHTSLHSTTSATVLRITAEPGCAGAQAGAL